MREELMDNWASSHPPPAAQRQDHAPPERHRPQRPADASRQVNAINRPLVVSISVCPAGAASSFDGNRLLECSLPKTHSLITRAIHVPGGVTEGNAPQSLILQPRGSAPRSLHARDPRTDAFHTQGGLSPTWVASRNPPQSCMNGARSRMYRATSRPCCSPTVQARRKWIPTNMRENAFSRAASSTLS